MRRARALINQLPAGALVDHTTNPNAAEWSLVVEMLASLIEVVDATSWRAVMPHTSKSWRPPKPLKVPRPSDPNTRRAKGLPMAKFRQLVGANNVTYVPPKGGEHDA